MSGGGFGTMFKTHLVSARTRRRANGLSLPNCNLSGAQSGGGGGGGGGNTLTRSASGILFYDAFIRSDRALNGDNGWVDDAGTWSIVSNVATSSGGNFDRCRNTGLATAAAAMYEWRCQAPSGGIYMMPRLMAGATTDFHLDLKGDNTDKRLAHGAASDTTIASITLTMDTSYHVVKVWYTTVPDGSRDFVVYFDRVAKLGSLATPFHSTIGPTTPGNPGLMGYGGAPLFDWVLVSSGHIITVTGLTTGQGFRLLDPSNTVIGSSGAQSGGTATLDIATLTDGLTNGHLQVYNDQGTWASPVTGARYPSSSDATDICGGDVYLAT